MENVWNTCCDKLNIVTCYHASFQQQHVHLNSLMRFESYYVPLLSHHFLAYSVSYSKIRYGIEAYKKKSYTSILCRPQLIASVVKWLACSPRVW